MANGFMSRFSSLLHYLSLVPLIISQETNTREGLVKLAKVLVIWFWTVAAQRCF